MEDQGWRKYYDDVNVFADRVTKMHGLEGFAVWNIEENLKTPFKMQCALLFWWDGGYNTQKEKSNG